MSELVTTAEISEAISFSKGPMWMLAVSRDRERLQSGKLNKGRHGGSLVADTLPELLTQTAQLMEQEGLADLESLSDYLQSVRGSKE